MGSESSRFPGEGAGQARTVLLALAIGILLGAGIAAAVLVRRGPRDHPERPEAVPAAESGKSTAAAEIERLGKDLAAAREELEEARRKRDDPGVAPTAGLRDRSTPGDIARMVAGLRAAGRDDYDSSDPDVVDLMRRLALYNRALALELGIPEGQVQASPEGLPALALAYLDSLNPPADASLRARVESAVADSRRQWAEFMKNRGSLVPVEAALESDRIENEFRESLSAAWSPSQDDYWSVCTALDWSVRSSEGRVEFNFSVMKMETFASHCSGSWSHALSLLPEQQRMLAPIVAQYVESVAALKSSGTMTDIPPAYANRGEAALMIRAQQRILAELSLSAEQKEALGHWTAVFTYMEEPEKGNEGK